MNLSIKLPLAALLACLLSTEAISQPETFLPSTATVSDALSRTSSLSHDLLSIFYGWEEQGLARKSEFESKAEYSARVLSGKSKGGVAPTAELVLQEAVGPGGHHCLQARYDAETAEFIVTCGTVFRYQRLQTTLEYGGVEDELNAFCMGLDEWKPRSLFPVVSARVRELTAFHEKMQQTTSSPKMRKARIWVDACLHVGEESAPEMFELRLPVPRNQAEGTKTFLRISYVINARQPFTFLSTTGASMGLYSKVLVANLTKVILSVRVFDRSTGQSHILAASHLWKDGRMQVQAVEKLPG